MGQISLEELIEKVDEIPVFPASVMKIIHLIEEDTTSAKDIEKEIMKDQGLTAKILKLANSAYYGLRRDVQTVSQAIVLLGFQAVKSMVLATSVGKVFDKEMPGYALGKEALWRQSQISAVMARTIAKKCKYDKADLVYTAGLLKDIGKVILDHYLVESYEEVIKKMESSDETFLEVEQQVLGFDHAQVGAKIAEKWHLPEELVEAIALHHEPEKAQINPKMTAIVHVGDVLIMMMGLHLGIDGLSYYISESTLEHLGLSESELQEIMSEIADIASDEGIYLEL